MTPLLILLALLMGAPPAVALAVSPLVAFDPVEARLTATVQPHRTNRILCFQIVSDVGIDTQSCRDLEGEQAPKTHTRWFKGLPAGNYAAQAYVLRAGDHAQFSVVVTFQVLGRF